MKTLQLLTIPVKLLFILILMSLTLEANNCNAAIDLGTPSNSGTTIENGTIEKGSADSHMWYKFTAPDNPNGADTRGNNYVGVKINYLNRDKQSKNVELNLWKGSCNNKKSLAYKIRRGKKHKSDIEQNIYHSMLIPGNEYYIRFKAIDDGTINYQLALSFYDTLNRSITYKDPHPKDFDVPLFQINLTGDLIAIGNSNYCTDFDRNGQCDSQGNHSLQAGNQAGNVIPIIYETTRTIAADGNVPSGLDHQNSYENQSKATLTLASAAKVKWAGLFWQGTIEDSSNPSKNSGDNRREAARQVEFKTPDGTIHSLTAQINAGRVNDSNTKLSDFRWLYYHDSFDPTERDVRNTEIDTLATYQAEYGAAPKSVNLLTWSHKDAFLYQGYVNVTNLINTDNASGEYTVSNITSDTGYLRPVGVLGAWTLIVVYEDDSDEFKNISVNDGFVALYDGHNQDAIMYAKLNGSDLTGVTSSDASKLGFYHRSVDIDIGGFWTPKAPATVNSTLTLFLGDGEGRATPAERLFVYKGDTKSNGGTAVEIDNGPGWNGSITDKNGHDILARSPNLVPVLAIDIRNFSAELDNEQLETTVRMEITSDRMLAGVFGFSTTLRKPKLCYDYAYKQYDHYFTQENNGSQDPYISGRVIASEPIDVRLYIKNIEDSDVEAQNVKMRVFDINETSEVKYERNSVRITKPNEIRVDSIADSSLASYGDDHISGIDIGTLNSMEYFYTYYKVDPRVSNVNSPIKGEVSFDLIIPTSSTSSTTIPFSVKTVEDQMSLCTKSNFKYAPAYGTFNVAQKDLYVNNSIYNIPTQVAQRVDDFIVVSHDYNASDLSTVHDERNVSTIVSVELIDAGAYHDINASCYEPDSAISPRIWLAFEGNITRVDLNRNIIQDAINNGYMSDQILNETDQISLADHFFTHVRENTAFRMQWNAIADQNDSLIQIINTANGIRIDNFANIHSTYPNCKQPVQDPNNSNAMTTDTAVACADHGNASTKKDVFICMECLFGYNTKIACSRDNFSVRPEAFNIKIYDQNQTQKSNTLSIEPNYTGVQTVQGGEVYLAAGYEYLFDINATNHNDNKATPGYRRGFGYKNSDYNLTFQWSPAGHTTSGCNDTNSSSFEFDVINGRSKPEIKHSQVGRYQSNMIDKMWTRVDWDINYTTHHTGPYFKSGADCIVDKTTVPEVNSVTPSVNGANLTDVSGCIIKSNHQHHNTLVTPNTAYKYRDYNLTFRPYEFKLSSIIASVALTGTDDFDGDTKFVYMSDIERTHDDNSSTNRYMAINFIGSINAVGHDGQRLSNYVDNCYAEDIDMAAFSTVPTGGEPDNSDGKSSTDLNLTRFIRITDSADVSDCSNAARCWNLQDTTSDIDTVDKSYFYKDMNGSIHLGYFINYNRRVIQPTTGVASMQPNNPAVRVFSDFNVSCTAGVDCSRYADLANNDYLGNKDLNNTQINFLYARTYTPRTVAQGNVVNAQVGYEVYCPECLSNSSFNTLLSDIPHMSTSPYGVGWMRSHSHDISRDGNITNLVPATASSSYVTTTFNESSYSNGFQPTTETYNGSKGYPYKTSIFYTPDHWLLYDKYSINAVQNSFEVEFLGTPGEWTGQGLDKAGKVDSNASGDSSRRIQW
jgi:hypothetical protein